MITVAVLINGQPVFARSATNTERNVKFKGKSTGEKYYKVDDGTYIPHHPDLGAISLAHKLLDRIKEGK